MIPENRYYSYNLGTLPRGCQSCVRGEKLVLFATGICPRQCYFCPLSDEKYQKDVTFANEQKVTSNANMLQEATAMNAKGAGITGGDPLSRLSRTVELIKVLKNNFGKEFHIHLYTSLTLITTKALEQLYNAGLDEIRFHLDLDSAVLWPKLSLAREFAWDVGIEIPCIPGKETEMKQLLDFVDGKVQFVNLNELERADNQMSKLGELGFQVKEKFSYAIAGSVEAGQELLEYVQQTKYPLSVHLCTAKLKDKIQLTNRIRREGQNNHKPFDIVSGEGLLIRGVVYLPELAPGFGYREKLARADASELKPKLEMMFNAIQKKLDLAAEDLWLDLSKFRILLAKKAVKREKKYLLQLGLVPAVVVEYPTADQLEVEVDILKQG